MSIIYINFYTTTDDSTFSVCVLIFLPPAQQSGFDMMVGIS